MNDEINKIFEQWKQFLSWCYENNDKTTEIHRDNLERVMAYTRQLENIIKEVREEIRILESNCDISDYQAQKLFKLIDKENNYE